MIVILPINLLGDAQLIAKRAELEDKLNTERKLTQAEASYLDSIVTEQNHRRELA